MSSQQSNFCWAPFKEAVIEVNGHILPCCQYKIPGPQWFSQYKFADFDKYWHQELQELRNNMIKGIDNPGCTYCLNSVKNMKDQINFQYINETSLEANLEVLEIDFSNYCNLKCIMCNSLKSSSINEEYTKHGDVYKKFGFNVDLKPTKRWWDEPGVFDNLLNLVKKLKVLKFAGGEPMMVPETLAVLKAASPDTILYFNTNMTKFTEPLWEEIKKFKQVLGTVSLEGTGIKNNYIRFNSNWENIHDGIMRLKLMPNVHVTIAHVLQHTSVYSLPDLMDYCDQYKLRFVTNDVYDPVGHLTLNSVSPQDMEIFKNRIQKYNNEQVNNWVKKYQFNSELHQRYQNYITAIDTIRKTNYKELFNPNWLVS
jgi:MoaA/NifB/PqqE/SkfB family radical SAM enzyme